jgi:phosphatidylserine decarboxylase
MTGCPEVLCLAVLGPHVPIDGDLYTVNPIAVNKNVNVFTMNKRVVCPLESPEFGTVGMIAVGATMVGSINFLRHEGDKVKKGDQHGYFAFGGSTVLVFFEKGAT